MTDGNRQSYAITVTYGTGTIIRHTTTIANNVSIINVRISDQARNLHGYVSYNLENQYNCTQYKTVCVIN